MGILSQLLDEVEDPKKDLTSQVRKICDMIHEEEKNKRQHPDLHPKGSKVFLSLEVPGRYDYEVGFLTLEREDVELYVAVYHTLEKNRIDMKIPPRRRKVFIINENKAEKILKKFAQTIKIIRSE